MQALWQSVGWHFSEVSVVFIGWFMTWFVSLLGDFFAYLKNAVTGRGVPVSVDSNNE